ncbi:MAG: T9SS type A sorting domain-containing protein [Bacteroidales bacterium]|nr:T9SS type A sorting domain-containing protein [Bacteroidales bacterium]
MKGINYSIVLLFVCLPFTFFGQEHISMKKTARQNLIKAPASKQEMLGRAKMDKHDPQHFINLKKMADINNQKSTSVLFDAKNVKNKSELCTDNLYQYGCSYGIDGLVYWNLANVNIPDIECTVENVWYHDYSDTVVHELAREYEYVLTVQTGYLLTYIDVWIDFNDDYELTNDELVVDDGYCYWLFLDYQFEIVLPSDAPIGEHLMRVRTNFNEPVTDPCATYNYGNCCDFSVNVTEAISTDVGVVSIDLPGVVEPGMVTPAATVKNFGTEAQSFDITFSVDNGYSSTISSTLIAPGETAQFEFDPWNASLGIWQIDVCTELAGDEIPENDCLTDDILVSDAKPAYGFMAVDPNGSTGVPLGPITFDLNDPETFYSLLDNPAPNFLSSACWFPGGIIYASLYLGGIYELDPVTGHITYLMPSPSLTGITYDGQKMYGLASDGAGNTLYEIDINDKELIEIGDVPTTGNILISIDFNAEGEMFGYDIADDTFYAIDKATGESTAIGPMGQDFAYAQDMSFDRDEGICYLAAYTVNNGGTLFTVDITTGIASFVADLDGNAEVTAFAIPYVASLPENDLAVQSVVSPITGTELTNQDTVVVRISNAGQNAQSNFEVSYSVNNGPAVTEIFSGTLDPNQNVFYAFETTVDLSAPDSTYIITVCVNLPGDENPGNDCAESSITHLLSILPPPQNLTGEEIDNDVYLSWNLPFYGNSYQIFNDDFEGYENGAHVAQNSSVWTTWTMQPGSVEDATISQDFASSPNQSMKMEQSNDMVYPTGNINMGKYEFTNKLYFPEGSSGGYVLLQHFEPNNYVWGSQVNFQANGSAIIDAGVQAAATFTYNFDEWMDVKSFINLDDDLAEFWVNDELIHSWQWSTGPFGTGDLNQLGAIDFYQPADVNFYVDDFTHDHLTGSVSGYSIYRDGEFIDFTSDTTYVDEGLVPGSYEYCVYAMYNEGSSEPACVTVDVTTDIAENVANGLYIYPVPTDDYLAVRSSFEIRDLYVYSIDGKIVEKINGINSNKLTLNLSSYKQGVYFIKVQTENDRVLIQKVIKK